MQETIGHDGVHVEELGELGFQSGWQELEKVGHFLVRFNFKLRLIAISKVVRQLLHQLGTNLKLLVKMLNLLNSLLICRSSLRKIRKVSGHVTQEVGEDGNAKNDDKEAPKEFVTIRR